MKRSGPPIRRIPLRRGPAPRGTPAGWGRPGKEAVAHRSAIRAKVFARDEHRCRLAGSLTPPCLGPLTVHHLRKASQGGPYRSENLLTLCAAHNDWVETSDAADRVHAWGLVIRRGETHHQAWARLWLAGIVTYDDHGDDRSC